ncbi:MAG: hypothetical protein U5R06_06400 [candidate division KSB1 bacterium]|nr:hypothetical protein [candidate division KSB1 bacterium]
MNAVESGDFQPVKQEGDATAAPKLNKELCRIDWSQSAQSVHNLIRGLSPYPGAFSVLHGKRLQILRSRPVEFASSNAAPGTVIRVEKQQVTVQTGNGQIALLRVKPQGKRAMSVEEYVRGYCIQTGDVFEN